MKKTLPRVVARLMQVGLVMGALLPWNATAIDRSDFIPEPGNQFSANYIEGLLVKSLFAITSGQLEEASR
ncbi:MAG TPA: hypothetical protein VEA39_00295, partial [Methylophilaceae bacterium]|nr:hypothetical protein [Methylophilaceae bacterium]